MTSISASNPTPSLDDLRSGDTGVARSLTPGTFLLVAVEIIVLSSLIGIYLIFRATYPQAHRPGLRMPHWGWGAAQALLVTLGTASVGALARRVHGAPQAAVMVLAALAAIYGLGALGLKAMEWACRGEPWIITVDVPAVSQSTSLAAQRRAAVPAKADPKQGAKAFAATCAACHGPGGEGVAQIAPSLKGSEFLAKSTDAQVVALISNGRLANDAASKTNKAMPARGGNPFLGDGDVAAIAAFLRDLAGGKASGEASATTAASAAAPRWVVPPPPPGPPGLSSLLVQSSPPVWIPLQFQTRTRTNDEKALVPIAAALGAFQGMHLLIGISLAMALLWHNYASPRSAALHGLARFACFHWAAAMALWAGLFPLLYIV